MKGLTRTTGGGSPERNSENMKFPKVIGVLSVVWSIFHLTEGMINLTVTRNPVSVGEDFLFRCVTDQPHTDINYGPTSSRLTATPESGSDIQLNFSSVTRADRGKMFMCNDGSVMTVTLDVAFAPEYTFTMTTYRQYTGQPLIISGQVNANPSPTVEWSRDGTVLTNSTRVQLFPAAVTFSSVKEEDNGTYTVTATNSEGSARVTVNLIAIYLRFALGINVTRPLPSLLPENDVLLSCAVAGSSPQLESVTFEYPNGTITDITATHNTPIRLTPAMISSREYTCTATNSDLSATLVYVNSTVTRIPEIVGGAIAAVVGTAVGGIVILSCIILFCPCCLCCLVCRRICCSWAPESWIRGQYQRKDNKSPTPHVKKQQVKGTKLEAGQQHYPTGGPTYQDPSTSEPQKATVGDAYTVVSTKKPVTDPVVEMVSYADPSIIKHQASPTTGDLYAQPEKDPNGHAPEYTHVDKSKQSGVSYAELEDKYSTSGARHSPPPNQVTYSEVSNNM